MGKLFSRYILTAMIKRMRFSTFDRLSCSCSGRYSATVGTPPNRLSIVSQLKWLNKSSALFTRVSYESLYVQVKIVYKIPIFKSLYQSSYGGVNLVYCVIRTGNLLCHGLENLIRLGIFMLLISDSLWYNC